MEGFYVVRDNNLVIGTNAAKLCSWIKMQKEQIMLDNIIATLKRWYWDRGNLEKVLNGIDAFWEKVKDVIAEEHIQELIEYGFLSLDKEQFKEAYNDFIEPFASGVNSLWEFYYDVMLDDAEKKAYREFRKANRGRIIGYGYGLTGGITAAASAGLGNLATGLAHGAFNTMANGVGNIQKSSKLSRFYKEDTTLNALINGLTETFWLIYEDHISAINQHIIEEGSSKLHSLNQLLTAKKSAENRFNNLQKVKKADGSVSLSTLIDCIEEFPFEEKYWLVLIGILATNGIINAHLYDSFYDCFSKIGDYIPSFKKLAPNMIGCLISVYILQSDSNKLIISVFQEKLKSDTDFQENFAIAIKKQFEKKDMAIHSINRLLFLIETLRYDLTKLKQDTGFVNNYNSKIVSIAYDAINKNRNAILDAIQSNNTDVIVELLKAVDSVSVFSGILHLISVNNITVTTNLFAYCENLKNAFKITQSLDDFEYFRKLKAKFDEQNRVMERKTLSIEAKVAEFKI